MSSSRAPTRVHPELLIVSPAAPLSARALCIHLVEQGVFFEFESPSRLPDRLPPSLDGYRAVILPAAMAASVAVPLAKFEARGGRVFAFSEGDWTRERFFERFSLVAGLEVPHPAMAARLEAVPDRAAVEECLGQSLACRHAQWTDVLRYHLEVLLGAHAQFREDSWLATAKGLIALALEKEPRDADNCDVVSCIYPMLRYAEIAPAPSLVERCRRVADSYLELARPWRGVLPNFTLNATEQGVLRAEIAFQVCPSLARLARVTGERRYADVAVGQILLLEKELADRKTGLWHFGRGPLGRTPCLWGRGAVFSLRGILDTLLELPPSHPSFSRLAALVRRMAKGLQRLQDREGFFHQVPDDPNSRAETSATAWGAAVLAKAVRFGRIEPSFGATAEKAWRAAKRRRWDGATTSICGGFTASMDRSYYYHPSWLPGSYGHFLALAGLEVLALRAAKEG